MKFTKLLLGTTLAVGVGVFTTLQPIEASASTETQYNTKEKIESKFLEIDAKYNVGEELSAEDQDFVVKYADKPLLKIKDPGPQYGSSSFTKYRTVAGIEARTWGTVSSNHGVWNNDYGANMTTQTFSGNANKIKNTVSHAAYGLVGSGGIGKVYSDSLSTTCDNGSSCKLNEKRDYTASVAYSKTIASGTVYYPGGSFTINPN
ncbi:MULTISPECIES: hypothetical protein [Bacillus cereus group]|uniref:hypothetical protein n=1 Tax=Bacillus cereus group TaxID=86661 RepID=UPI000DCA6E4E|nr:MULTISPECIES: hypothetical protein [Bacillus cereus group]MDA2314395.1 hypothetical protein [Bacillus cereus]MDA2319925.1 hypothetical protein [Bacillus cereus]MDA2503293.1 hypothetical protein [Bacillus cereus]MDF9612797.1 hypothetical protein [Bacillus cereus]RAT01470.1 hypothetical protein A6E25_14500 [Bacillus cereus]